MGLGKAICYRRKKKTWCIFLWQLGANHSAGAFQGSLQRAERGELLLRICCCLSEKTSKLSFTDTVGFKKGTRIESWHVTQLALNHFILKRKESTHRPEQKATAAQSSSQFSFGYWRVQLFSPLSCCLSPSLPLRNQQNTLPSPQT